MPDLNMTSRAEELYNSSNEFLYNIIKGLNSTVDAYDLEQIMITNPHMSARSSALIAVESHDLGYYPRCATYVGSKDRFARNVFEGMQGYPALSPVKNDNGEITGYKATSLFPLEQMEGEDIPFRLDYKGRWPSDRDSNSQNPFSHSIDDIFKIDYVPRKVLNEFFPVGSYEEQPMNQLGCVLVAEKILKDYVNQGDLTPAQREADRREVNSLFNDYIGEHSPEQIAEDMDKAQNIVSASLDWARDNFKYMVHSPNIDIPEEFAEGELFGVPVLISENMLSQEIDVPDGLWEYFIDRDDTGNLVVLAPKALEEWYYINNKNIISVLTPTAIPDLEARVERYNQELWGFNADFKVGEPTTVADYFKKIDSMSLNELSFSRNAELITLNQDILCDDLYRHRRMAGLYSNTMDFETGKPNIQLQKVVFPPKDFVFEQDGSFDKLFGADCKMPENATVLANINGELNVYDVNINNRCMTQESREQSLAFTLDAISCFHQSQEPNLSKIVDNPVLDNYEILAVYKTNESNMAIVADSKTEEIYIQYDIDGQTGEKSGIYSGPYKDMHEAEENIADKFPGMIKSTTELLKAKQRNVEEHNEKNIHREQQQKEETTVSR